MQTITFLFIFEIAISIHSCYEIYLYNQLFPNCSRVFIAFLLVLYLSCTTSSCSDSVESLNPGKIYIWEIKVVVLYVSYFLVYIDAEDLPISPYIDNECIGEYTCVNTECFPNALAPLLLLLLEDLV